MAEIDITTNPAYPVLSAANPTERTFFIREIIRLAPPGSVIYFPTYNYTINGQIFSRTQADGPITLRGDNTGASKIILDTGTDPDADPIFLLQGDANCGDARWFQMRDLYFSGAGVTRSNPWMRLYRVSNIRLDRVLFQSTLGMAIHGQQLRDSVFHDVQFGEVGDTDVAQMLIESISGVSGSESMNLVFEACRWEQNPAAGVQVKNAIRLSFLECKWHGAFPAANSGYAHCDLTSTYLTTITGCRFTNAGSTDAGFLAARNASGLLVNSCLFNGVGLYGIKLENTNDSVVCGNYIEMTSGTQVDVSNGNATDAITPP